MVWSATGDIIVPADAQPNQDYIDLTTSIPPELAGVVTTGIIINNGSYNPGTSGASIKYWFLGPFINSTTGTKQLVCGMVTTQGEAPAKYTKIFSADVDPSNALTAFFAGVKMGDTGWIDLSGNLNAPFNTAGAVFKQRVLNGVSYVEINTGAATWSGQPAIGKLAYPPTVDHWGDATLFGNSYCPLHVDTAGYVYAQANGSASGVLGSLQFPV